MFSLCSDKTCNCMPLKTAENKKQTWREDGGTISVGRPSKSEPKRQWEMLQHMTQRELLCHQSSSRYRACAKWNFSTLHHLFLAVNANSNPYTLASKGRLSPERHLRTCLAATACGQLRYVRVCWLFVIFTYFYMFSREILKKGSFLLCANWQWKLQDSASHCLHIMLHMGPSPEVGFHQYAQQLKAKNARETSWKSHEQSEVSKSFLRLH